MTADSIKLGLAGVDPEEVRAFGIEFNGPSSKQLYEAWIAATNENGGVQRPQRSSWPSLRTCRSVMPRPKRHAWR